MASVNGATKATRTVVTDVPHDKAAFARILVFEQSSGTSVP